MSDQANHSPEMQAAFKRVYGENEAEKVARLHRQLHVRHAVFEAIKPHLPLLPAVRCDRLAIRSMLRAIRR